MIHLTIDMHLALKNKVYREAKIEEMNNIIIALNTMAETPENNRKNKNSNKKCQSKTQLNLPPT